MSEYEDFKNLHRYFNAKLKPAKFVPLSEKEFSGFPMQEMNFLREKRNQIQCCTFGNNR